MDKDNTQRHKDCHKMKKRKKDSQKIAPIYQAQGDSSFFSLAMSRGQVDGICAAARARK